MNNKLLIALSLMAMPAIAMEHMELTKEQQSVIPSDTTEEKVVITIQDQEREIPKRYIPLIETLAALYTEGTFFQMSPITLVSLDTWKIIEDQLERVYAMTQGNKLVGKEIVTAYSQLDSTNLIELIMAVDFLGVPLLKPIMLEIAQGKLTLEEVLTLPQAIRNEIIIRKAINTVGPLPLKEKEKIRVRKAFETVVCSLAASADVIVSGASLLAIIAMNGERVFGRRAFFGDGYRGASICSVYITPDRKIVSSDDRGTIAIHDIFGEELAAWKGHKEPVWSISPLADGRIVSGSEDGTVRLWDMKGQALALLQEQELGIRSVCVTPDDKVVSLSVNGMVSICDPNDQESVVCKDPGVGVVAFWSLHKVGAVAFRSLCVADNKVICGFGDKTVRIWDMTGTLCAVCRGHEKGITSVQVTSNGKKIVSGSLDNTLRVWDREGKQLAVCQDEASKTDSCAFKVLPGAAVCVTEDDYLVFGSGNKTIRVFNLHGQELACMRGYEERVTVLCEAADGNIVAGYNKGVVRIWDMSLLRHLSAMNYDQAQSIWQILQTATPENQEEKELCWQEIRKVFEEN